MQVEESNLWPKTSIPRLAWSSQVLCQYIWLPNHLQRLLLKNGVQAFLLVYVDDILLIGSNDNFLKQFITKLSDRFSLKYLSYPHYFFWIEMIPNRQGLLLSQHRYICDLLEKFNMAGAKPNNTPLCLSITLKLKDGSASADSHTFISIIGALQYVTLTRLDLAFTINKLSHFMHQPSQYIFNSWKEPWGTSN